jgi:type I restriction enzyme M protein
MDAEPLYRNREAFTKALKKAAKAANVGTGHAPFLRSPILKTLLSALGERDEEADICRDKQGNPEPDSELRDYENVPLKEDIEAYFAREVLPHVPDAWIDHDKTKIGYEISFTRYFYQYQPLRSLAEIQADILALEEKTHGRTKDIIG